jgi:hypothetical protein
MITAIASALGISTKAARIGTVVIGVLLLIGAFYLVLDAYGDAKFEQGEQHADQAWKDASNQLVQDSLEAGTKADHAAAARQLEYAAQVEAEKEKIDEAVLHGTSPLDVLFPVSGSVRQDAPSR